MNIVLTALQACGVNGRVRITTSVERLDQETLRQAAIGGSLPEGAYACIAVEDTGLGIPMEIRNRIFDPQFTTRVHGRGLGLAVVKQIAQRHGIAIEIESEPGEGSVFRAFIPLRASVTGF
jgi:signal transduction histidine kinase